MMPSDSRTSALRFYKYRSLEDDKSRRFAADILLNHRLYAPRPSELNDPYDCKFDVSFESTNEQRLQRAIDRLQSEDRRMSYAEARLNASSRLHLLKTYGTPKLKRFVENLGVVSLATSNKEPLLWSRYANNHAGICIEFKCTSLRHTEFFGNALPVSYYNTRSRPNFILEKPEDYMTKLIFSKSTQWSYEAEYRILNRRRSANKYVDFDPSIISAIYFGAKISDENRDAVINWLRERSAPSYPKLVQARFKSTTKKWKFDSVPLTGA